VVGALHILSAMLADMEGKIPMAARRHVTNKLHSAYRKAAKRDKARILDEVMATTGMGRSTARQIVHDAGDLDRPFATAEAITQLQAMSPATIDSYLAPVRRSMQLRGISTTRPSPLLRNSTGLSKVGDAPPTVPGVIEANTVAHCGPTFFDEFARTLTMTDLVTRWTENASTGNNASKWIVGAVAQLQTRFPFP
jgi:hypothetical protein